MKTIIFCALTAATPAIAQEPKPGPTPDVGPRTFFERTFAPPQGIRSAENGVARNPQTPEFRIYPDRQQADGKALGRQEAAALPEGNYANQQLYLAGKFKVTAKGENHVVLRYEDTTKQIRVIVECLPSGTTISDGKGETVESSHRLQLIQVKKAGNGLNLQAREVAEPAK